MRDHNLGNCQLAGSRATFQPYERLSGQEGSLTLLVVAYNQPGREGGNPRWRSFTAFT